MSRSTAEFMPESKDQLTACMLSRNCLSSKNGIRTHMYVMPEWFRHHASPVSAIKCFVTDFQEPYVMLRYAASTPLFDERFINYGYNKVQLIEHLRAAGFQFYILNDAFAVDLPHPDSKYRTRYLNGLQKDYSNMRETYSQFQKELNERYKAVKPFRICTSVQSSYYLSV